MEPTTALDQILDDSDYNESDGYSSEEGEDYPEDTTLQADMLDLYQVCFHHS